MHNNTSARWRRKYETQLYSSAVAILILLFITVALLIWIVGVAFALDDYEQRISQYEQTIVDLEEELYETGVYYEGKLAETKDDYEKQLRKFVNPIQYDRAAAPIYDVPLSEALQQHTYDMCRYYNIPEHYETLLAVMWQESNFVEDEISSTEDYGLMQINKVNHKYLRENLGIVDILDAEANIEAGTYIFSTLLTKYGDTDRVLMAYNMGESGAAAMWTKGNYKSAYTEAVRAKLNKLQK